ncbi:MAG: polyprenyl synthetase family protein [Clostridia bacterium]|nr:polyprenyl synthetase family protein [Clostridia bacterium]
MTNNKATIIDKKKFSSFDEAIGMVRDSIEQALRTSPRVIREYTTHLSKSAGKYIRGVSLLTCGIEEDGSIHQDAVRFATAIELIHLATLVHDDVIDNADVRRGEISLQKKYGKRTAVICGDYLLCTALTLAAQASDKDKYIKLDVPTHLNRVVLGELSQHVNNGNFDLSVFRYLKIISGKTAALFEASFYAGAVLCETDDKVISQYARLGRYIGMTFQLNDDCLDFESTQVLAKKPVQSDYEQNVITLPLIHSFRVVDGFREKAKAIRLSRDEINEAVRSAGGLIYTHAVAKKYYKKALALLDALPVSGEKRNKMLQILNKAYKDMPQETQ